MNNKMEQKSKQRHWCFTLHDWTEEELEKIINSLRTDTSLCGIIGKELCPTTGRKHLQGYVSFKNPRAFSGVKKIIEKRCHLEVAKGSSQDNYKYCSKDGDFIEWGEFKENVQGKRTDLDDIRRLILEEGKQADEILPLVSNFQQLKFMEGLLRYQPNKKREPPKVYWFYGKSDTHKTRTAYDMCKEEPWMSGKNLKWWEGYHGQKEVIIDDFRADFCTFHELLRILDRYPYRVEVKCGSTQLLAEVIFITSPYHPADAYCKEGEELKQLSRRITEIRKFTGPGEYIIENWNTEQESVGNTSSTDSIIDMMTKELK